MSTQKEIIDKCRNGDRTAFRELVKSYHRLVFSIALKMLADEDSAKDVVQETFVRVWQNLRSYDDSRKFSTWICTIASRLCLDQLEKQKRMSPLPDDEKVFDSYVSDSNISHQLENKDWISIVRTLADNLSPKQKLVFTLSQLEGMESSEIVEITGMDADKIKKNLYVARQTIKQQLIRLGYER